MAALASREDSSPLDLPLLGHARRRLGGLVMATTPVLTDAQWANLVWLKADLYTRVGSQAPRISSAEAEELSAIGLVCQERFADWVLTSAGRLALALHDELHAMARTLAQDTPRYYRAHPELPPGQYVVQPYDDSPAIHRLWRWDGKRWFNDRGDQPEKGPHSVYGGALPTRGAPW